MSTPNQTLGEWAAELNDIIFMQPNTEVALKALYEKVDPSLVMKINHTVCLYSQFVSIVEQARKTTTMFKDTWDVLHEWQDPEKKDGVVAISTKWRIKDNATGVETKKNNWVIWEVKLIDGKRKLTAMTEVE
ncbi:hypothetical protein BELL_0406g00030 [Botrytis elliptica]|uniref:DUF4440 domain-containing protein n=1 Tax=Botrytis elliptica TaxID=278938 RepID=A0A4Z1JGY4_9HELO|nr:hypothetical protein EAE99_009562 [Botrytis elliptica]TGO72921.1 hypothetical protein BELL_0406g00030 [Botrytis elliptica]